MNTKRDYELAVSLVGATIRKWDPYSLLAQGAPSDEFEAEIAAVVTHIPRIRTPEDAATALSSAFSKAFEPHLFSPAACAEPGAELFVSLVRGGLVHAQPAAPAEVVASRRPG